MCYAGLLKLHTHHIFLSLSAHFQELYTPLCTFLYQSIPLHVKWWYIHKMVYHVQMSQTWWGPVGKNYSNCLWLPPCLFVYWIHWCDLGPSATKYFVFLWVFCHPSFISPKSFFMPLLQWSALLFLHLMVSPPLHIQLTPSMHVVHPLQETPHKLSCLHQHPFFQKLFYAMSNVKIVPRPTVVQHTHLILHGVWGRCL